MALFIRKLARCKGALPILATVLFFACACSNEPYLVQIIYEPPPAEEVAPIARENVKPAALPPEGDALGSAPVPHQPVETPREAAPPRPNLSILSAPSPTPTILPTFTPLPTPILVLSFTPAPTPIPTPMPSPSPTPTPTPTPSPTASPGVSSTADPQKMIEEEHKRHAAALRDIEAKYDQEMHSLMDMINTLEGIKGTSTDNVEALQAEIDNLLNQISVLAIPMAEEIALEDARHAEALAAYGG